MTSATDAPRTSGRPRDPGIDDAVLAATTSLLEELGYAGTTVKAISRRSGVGTPAIYRRWAGRVELVEAAVFPPVHVPVPRPTGDLQADVQAYVDVMTAALSRPAARAALPGLLTEYIGDPERYAGVTLRVGLPIRDAFHALLADQPSGTVDPDVDPDSVLDLLAASVLYELFILPFTGREAHTNPAAEIVVRALRADGAEPDHPPSRRRT